MKTRTQHDFARVLGRRPQLRSVVFELIEPSAFQTFGPPELANHRKSAVLYWNFQREDGRKKFTLFARIHQGTKSQDVKFSVAAERGGSQFLVWVLDRLGSVSSGDQAPLFIGSGAFRIASFR